RELLEQADALMRRNRQPPAPLVDIPVLTDAVPEGRLKSLPPLPGEDRAVSRESFRPPEPLERASSNGQARAPADRLRPSPRDEDDIPILTDAVEEIDAALPIVDDVELQSRWLYEDRGETSITGPAPDSVVVVPAPPPSSARANQARASETFSRPP